MYFEPFMVYKLPKLGFLCQGCLCSFCCFCFMPMFLSFDTPFRLIFVCLVKISWRVNFIKRAVWGDCGFLFYSAVLAVMEVVPEKVISTGRWCNQGPTESGRYGQYENSARPWPASLQQSNDGPYCCIPPFFAQTGLSLSFRNLKVLMRVCQLPTVSIQGLSLQLMWGILLLFIKISRLYGFWGGFWGKKQKNGPAGKILRRADWKNEKAPLVASATGRAFFWRIETTGFSNRLSIKVFPGLHQGERKVYQYWYTVAYPNPGLLYFFYGNTAFCGLSGRFDLKNCRSAFCRIVLSNAYRHYDTVPS